MKNSAYGCYLTFQLFSHKALYDEDAHGVFQSTKYVRTPEEQKKREERHIKKMKRRSEKREKHEAEIANGEQSAVGSLITGIQKKASLHTHDHEQQSDAASSNSEEHHSPEMSLPTTLLLLVIVTVVSLLFNVVACDCGLT